MLNAENQCLFPGQYVLLKSHILMTLKWASFSYCRRRYKRCWEEIWWKGTYFKADVFPMSEEQNPEIFSDLLQNLSVEWKRYQGLEILPIPIFCQSNIADNLQTSNHRLIEQYLPIGQCICRYANYLPIVNAFQDIYANIYRQIFFSIGRYFFLFLFFLCWDAGFSPGFQALGFWRPYKYKIQLPKIFKEGEGRVAKLNKMKLQINIDLLIWYLALNSRKKVSFNIFGI